MLQALRGWALQKFTQRSYQQIAADQIDRVARIRGKRVLVVGANKGEDCRLFIERGAAEVHGLDVIEDIGRDFQHPNVHYHRASIEGCDIPSDSFDVVFSVATMEHVPNIQAGFAEMVRLARPGGIIVSHASPLWQSPYGHHMACFEGHPWVHLVFERDELVEYALSNDITGERDIKIDYIVNYMLDPTLFNRTPGHKYLAACENLRGIRIRKNRLNSSSAHLLNHNLGRRALAKGFTERNLLGVHHHFAATKSS